MAADLCPCSISRDYFAWSRDKNQIAKHLQIVCYARARKDASAALALCDVCHEIHHNELLGQGALGAEWEGG